MPKSGPQDHALSLQSLFKAALTHVNNTCVLGASNRYADILKTSGWVIATDFRYTPSSYLRRRYDNYGPFDTFINAVSMQPKIYQFESKVLEGQWFYKVSAIDEAINPESVMIPLFKDDPIKALPFPIGEMFKNNVASKERRSGTCGDRCYLLASYLWQNGKDIDSIALLKMTSFDHVVLAVNLNGDLTEPSTWNCGWIIDPWYQETPDSKGLIIQAMQFSDYISKIKAFSNQNRETIAKYNISLEEPENSKKETCIPVFEIKPSSTDPYPLQDSALSVEEHYQLEDYRFPKKNRLNEEKKLKIKRSPIFEKIKTEIQALKDMPLTMFFDTHQKKGQCQCEEKIKYSHLTSKIKKEFP